MDAGRTSDRWAVDNGTYIYIHKSFIKTVYGHFGPWSLRSSVISVLRKMTEDRSDQGV